MTQLPSAFNSNEHDNMNDFTAVPADDYFIQVKESEMKNCGETAKDPKGKFLKLTFIILGGKYKGRLLWTQLNLINKNPEAVAIAQKELATICKAVGLVSITDSQELHGKPMKAKVAIIPAKANWPEKNEIKFYSKAEGEVKAAPVESEKPDPNAGKGDEKKKAPKPWE